MAGGKHLQNVNVSVFNSVWEVHYKEKAMVALKLPWHTSDKCQLVEDKQMLHNTVHWGQTLTRGM